MRRSSVPKSLLFLTSARWRVVWAGWALLAADAPAQTADLTPAAAVEAPAILKPASSPADSIDDPAGLDVLVYNDGDRLRGRLVRQADDVWLFESQRFGLLRVPLKAAKILLARPGKPAIAAVPDKPEERESYAASRWAVFSPHAMAEALGSFFGPWHGRFAVSTEFVSDTTERTNDLVDAHLQRKLAQDDVKLNARYNFSDTNHVTTTDLIKVDAAWRHDFSNHVFSIYGPKLEWNRAFALNGVPSDYVLLQQEVGAGLTLLANPRRNLRVGVAENVFDLWQTSTPESHTSKTAESLFMEADWKLPWRMSVTERGVWYYSFNNGGDGWENKLELDKKLTETFAVGIRHEKRNNNPGVRVQDYSLLKLLMGVDF